MDQDCKKIHDNGVSCDRDWNELNELTLSVMSNRNRYDKYKKTVSNASYALIEQF